MSESEMKEKHFFCIFSVLTKLYKMPGKPQAEETHTFFVQTIGSMGAAMPVIAPKCSSIGMGPAMVNKEIAKVSAAFKGVKIRCRVDVCNRVPTVTLLPGASSYILKALKEPMRDRKKVKNILHDGNLSLNDVIEIAGELRERSMSRHFAGTVREVLGTCRSVGCTVENKTPKEWTDLIKKDQLETEDQIRALV
ncbi:hypothetical protein PCE1_003143 [Barthelona sp. PCE]